MNKKKKPLIRFKGFTDDWEQRKLHEVADIIGGGTPSTNNSDYWDGDKIGILQLKLAIKYLSVVVFVKLLKKA